MDDQDALALEPVVSAILDTVADGILILDSESRVTYANDCAERLVRRSRSALIGHTLAEVFPDLIGSRLQAEARRVRAEQRSVVLKEFHPAFDAWFEIHLSPATTGLVVLFRDVTAQEQASRYEAERAARLQTEAINAQLRGLQSVTDAALAHLALDDLLRELLVRVRGLLEADTAVILMLDGDGEQLLVRAALGLEEEVRQKVRVPVGSGFAGAIAATRQPVLIEDINTITVCSPILRSEGVQSLLGVPLLIEGALKGVLHVGTLTQRRFCEDEVQLLQAVADRAVLAIENARLYEEAQAAIRARDEFLAIASHELRTPLTSIKTFAHALQRLLGAQELERTRLSAVIAQQVRQIGRFEQLVSDLLDVSRIQLGRLVLRVESLDLVQLARDLVDRFIQSPEHTPGHTLVLDAPATLVVRADAMRMEQVLANLLSNALKYSPGGGEVRVILRQNEGEALITVRDQGIGIQPAAQAVLFQPFARGEAGRRNINGVGLGLYITAEIVRQHGGTISIESPPGEGTAVTIHVPLP